MIVAATPRDTSDTNSPSEWEIKTESDVTYSECSSGPNDVSFGCFQWVLQGRRENFRAFHMEFS